MLPHYRGHAGTTFSYRGGMRILLGIDGVLVCLLDPLSYIAHRNRHRPITPTNKAPRSYIFPRPYPRSAKAVLHISYSQQMV